ncbi:MAG: RNA-guided endonuclease TnpB family protein [Ktedonobacteraceae bacterium]
MAKATTTNRQILNHKPEHGVWFAANQALFNQVAAFYFSVVQAHELVLELGNQEALTALERLTHKTQKNPNPIMPLYEIAEDVPSMFRRAAIHAALGSARSFYAHLKSWRARKEKALAKGKKWTSRPPVPPRSWKKSATIYAGQWKERSASSIMLKVWTGSCWSWVRCRLTGRELPDGAELGSPQLVRHGKQWWLHTPVERKFSSPPKVEEQITKNAHTKICAVDMNIDGRIAVCTVQTAEGSTLATRFMSGGTAVSGFRKQQLGRIARNRSKTGLLAPGEQDNADLWRKINQRDEDFAHQVSHRIVQFATEQGATIIVFEHLGNLQPEKGRYSHRGNQKRAFWMKGRIFRYSKYKAWNQTGIITCRVNPKNTSRECARCSAQIIRYAQGQLEEGYQVGAPLVVCPVCKMRGHADRNASLNIGRKLLARSQQTPAPKEKTEEKPQTPQPRAERSAKVEGVISSQDARGEKQPSIASARHGTGNGHGTAHKGKRRRMGTVSLSIPPTLRPPMK